LRSILRCGIRDWASEVVCAHALWQDVLVVGMLGLSLGLSTLQLWPSSSTQIPSPVPEQQPSRGQDL
jgi:hypothetical protein